MEDNNEAKRKRVESFLKKNYKGEFIISETPNEEGRYEVSSSGFVKMISKSKSLAIEDFVFTEVFCFDCSGNGILSSLKGAPKKVNIFNCSECTAIETLKGAPEKANVFDCSHCQSLKFLKGAPKKVEIFDCRYCESLYSFEGAPEEMGKFYYGFN